MTKEALAKFPHEDSEAYILRLGNDIELCRYILQSRVYHRKLRQQKDWEQWHTSTVNRH